MFDSILQGLIRGDECHLIKSSIAACRIAILLKMSILLQWATLILQYFENINEYQPWLDVDMKKLTPEFLLKDIPTCIILCAIRFLTRGCCQQ